MLYYIYQMILSKENFKEIEDLIEVTEIKSHINL